MKADTEILWARRSVLAAAGTLAVSTAPAMAGAPRAARLAEIEARVKGRLGVFAMRDDGSILAAYRADERFPMASTFKMLLAAAVLNRVDRGEERLDRRLAYGPADILSTSPVTSASVGKGRLDVATLCGAVLERSDNTAANLLLKSVGGPPGLTRYARSLGDTVTRLDRKEMELNTAIPGDPRDTTSPRAMAHTVQQLVLGDRLSTSSRARLKQGMLGSQTGLTLLRAGVPGTWRVGDKTGRGGHGSTNNIAVLWPPNSPPIVAAVYLTQSAAPVAEREAAIADVGRVISRG